MHLMKDNNQTIEKSNLAERVYRKIRDSLTVGEFLPGERLRIREMANMYGTSTTPVREALLRLVSEHALDMEAATKIVVPALSLNRYREIRNVRCALEALAAEAAMLNLQSVDIEKLEEINSRFAIAESKKIAKDMFSCNREFHFFIYSRCHQPILLALIDNMAASMGPILRSFYESSQQDYNKGAEQHAKIIAALRNKEGESVKSALKMDITLAGGSIEAFLREVEAAENASAQLKS
jgi:DNA-binding GntR family transcriptional regulator